MEQYTDWDLSGIFFNYVYEDAQRKEKDKCQTTTSNKPHGGESEGSERSFLFTYLCSIWYLFKNVRLHYTFIHMFQN